MTRLATGRGRNGDTLPRVRAVSRAIAILRCFSPDQMHLSLGEISEAARLDAGTTRRLLVTLRDEDLVAQGADGKYSLTMQLWRLAAAVPEGRSLRDRAVDLLQELASSTGHTVLLSVLRQGQAVCIAREHGNAPVQVRWWPVGESLPLNCGAAPTLLLAFMPEPEREAVLAGHLTALTRKSITNPLLLRDRLAEIRRDGWSLSTDDVVEGLSALAAPVRDFSGAVVGAVSLGGLTSTIIEDDGRVRSDVLATLLANCREISTRTM